MTEEKPEMLDITPRPLTPAELTEIDEDIALENACTAALGRHDPRLGLVEDDLIPLAEEIVADYAARGERLRLSRAFDRLRLIVSERFDPHE
jgi:hypothetical protein